LLFGALIVARYRLVVCHSAFDVERMHRSSPDFFALWYLSISPMPLHG